MIVHLPMMMPIFPANVILIMNVLIPTISFDILDTYFDWENLEYLKFDFETHDNIKSKILN